MAVDVQLHRSDVGGFLVIDHHLIGIVANEFERHFQRVSQSVCFETEGTLHVGHGTHLTLFSTGHRYAHQWVVVLVNHLTSYGLCTGRRIK